MTTYEGDELELFAGAVNWKRYWGSQLRQFVRGEVLDVGAGIGSSIDVLGNARVSRWLALEPDPALAAVIRPARHSFPVDVVTGTLGDVRGHFDTVLYIDVLEHIADDSAEVRKAAQKLMPGGHLVVLSPAHMNLMSEFDHAIGHYRRYNRAMLAALTPPGTQLISCRYLDSVGMLASAANRYLLRQDNPNVRQVAFWDRVLVPLSRVIDPVTLHRLGKTIIAVWRQPSG